MEQFTAAEDLTFKWNYISEAFVQAVCTMELPWFWELSSKQEEDSHGCLWVVASFLYLKLFTLFMSDIGISPLFWSPEKNKTKHNKTQVEEYR